MPERCPADLQLRCSSGDKQREYSSLQTPPQAAVFEIVKVHASRMPPHDVNATETEGPSLALAALIQVAYSSGNFLRRKQVSTIVYKIVEEADWRAAQRSGFYQGSADDQRDGYIHLSFAEQVEGTAARHFANRSTLLLIAFRTEDLGDALRLERSRGGALFPHLYAELATASALWEHRMIVGEDGIPRAPGVDL